MLTRRESLRMFGLGGVGLAAGAAALGVTCRSSRATWPITVGRVRIWRVVETEAPMAMPADWFPTATDEAVRAERSWLEPHFIAPDSGRLIFSIQSLVIQTQRHTIVVETGNGNGNDSESAEYLTRFRRTGSEPKDVDFVVATHMHYDHIGWNVRRQAGRAVPTFPRARYLLVRDEWNYWSARKPGEFGQEAIQAAVVPIVEAGMADIVDARHRIDEEAELVPVFGHTPGHVVVRVSSQGSRAIVGGDILHHPVQCAYPDWQSQYEIDPQRSRRTRVAFLERYAATDTLIIPAHFPTPAAGWIVRERNAFRFRITV